CETVVRNIQRDTDPTPHVAGVCRHVHSPKKEE
ncbi:MAG: hypothetical protein ACI9W2_002691, partial [Gammaproteobacteria bacterium]